MPRVLGRRQAAQHAKPQARGPAGVSGERRKAAGLTQAVLAERLKVHRSYVADIERGQRRVDVVELFALAEAIGFDPSEAIERMKG